MRVFPILYGTAALALSAAPAFADDLTVSNGQTTPVTTKAAANNTPGNITVTGNISVPSGTAATINSNNFLNNSGTITSAGSTNTTALLIDGTTPLTGILLTNTGTISVTGTATGATGNIGLAVANGPVSGMITSGLLTGSISVTGDNAFGVSLAAPFTGNVVLRSVSVTGATSTAVSVSAPLTGNLTLTGASSSTGAGGYGLNVTAPITGAINNGGTISAGTAQTTDNNGNIVSGAIAAAAVHVGANVTGGIVNDRYYVDPTGATVPTPTDLTTTTDTLVTGTISSTGGAPAIAVTPSATNPQAITIGAVGVVGSGDEFAIVNRGAIQVSTGAVGQPANGILVGGGGTAAPTTLVGGIDSQLNSSFAISAVDATSTGIHLLSGAVVPTIINAGTFSVATSATAAVGSTPTGPGGNGYGIVVEQGATLGSVLNTGIIAVTGVGTGNSAYGIVDRSGTLTQIINSGTIATTAGANRVAIDLSASGAAVVVSNTGAITGDIVFGTGASTLNLGTGSSIIGAVAFGAGPGTLNLSGTASLTSGLSTKAPLAVTLQDTALLDLTTGPTTLASVAATGSSALVVPVTPGGVPLLVNGTASFLGASTVRLSLQSLNAAQSLSIIQANGGLTTDHLATLVDATTAPYLFTATSPVISGNVLSITLARKSAADIGLVGAQALLYTNSIPALANSPVEASAIANLPTQAAVVAAYRQITPPSFGRGVLRSAQALSDQGFGAAAARLAVVDELHREGQTPHWGVWVQELGDFETQAPGTNEAGFDTSSFGLAAGVDAPVLGLNAGLAAITDWSNVRQTVAPGYASTPVRVSTQGVEPYVSKSWKSIYVQLSALAAHNTYNSLRTIDIGSVTDLTSAHWSGWQYGAGATVGGEFRFGHFRLRPLDAISYTRLEQGAYDEAGAGAFGLGVGKQTDSAAANTSKVSLAYLIKLIDSSLELEVHAGYVHQFETKATKTDIHFLTLPGDPFTATGDAVKAEELSYGGGVGYVQDDFKLKFGYDRRQQTGFHDQSLALSAGFSF